jgi:uncharacterized membrane protein YbaN (DUF454 family)
VGSTSSNKGRPRRTSRPTTKVISAGQHIEFDSKARALRICDPRLIKASQLAFCQRLLEAATRRPGISKAEIDVKSSSCRIEFRRGATTAQKMADAFAECVREAAASSSSIALPLWDASAADSLTLTAYPLSGDVSLWEKRDTGPGQISIRNQNARLDHDRLSKLADEIAGFDEVEGCHALPGRQGLTIDLREKNGALNGFFDDAQRSLEQLLATNQAAPAPDASFEPARNGTLVTVATGPKRFWYLALAGGAFVMTLVGLVVPGIPTIPFLLATSYFLSRSSRSLNEKLTRSAFFGPIIVDWEQHAALSRSSKSKLIGLTVIIVTVAIALGPLSLVGILILLAIASFSIYGINQMPDLPEEQRAGDPRDGGARFALPAP